MRPAVLSVILFGLGILSFAYTIFAPRVTTDTVIVVSRGDTARDVAEKLVANEVLKTPYIFLVVTKVISREGFVAGEYTISLRDSVYSIVSRMERGQTNTKPLVFTIPEGSTIEEIAKRAALTLPEFSFDEFIKLTNKQEGYLFPETYYFTKETTTKDVVEAMSQEFTDRTAYYQKQAQEQNKKFTDVVIMASVLEKEAKTLEEKKIIAGILYKRLRMHMPLQVDATFLYTHHTGSADLTLTELRDDSPYNTYTRQGLPIGPICNPGLQSFEAALNPIETNYLYYLTGTDGKMHYAKTFEEHIENKKLYLR